MSLKNLQYWSEHEFIPELLRQLPSYIFWKNTESIYLGCNEAFAHAVGLSSPKEVIGKSDNDLPIKMKETAAYRADDKQVMESRQPKLNIEETQTFPDGHTIILLTSKVPLLNKNGEVVGVLGIYSDITERKKIEAQLQETEHKLTGMTVVAASIAHELRTPLAGIYFGITSMEKSFKKLVSTYQLAEQAGLPIVDKFRSNELENKLKSFEALTRQVSAADVFIDILLTNLSSPKDSYLAEPFSIVESVNKALERYPLHEDQKQLIYWNDKDDFLVKGNNELVIHILFNLIKNALYYTAKADKPIEQIKIQIWLEKEADYNKLYFKDTGTGISTDILPHIFERFFSKTIHGAGIGLSFCKMAMESLGGIITCDSVEGEYTLFTLAFPNENVHNK